MIGKLLARLRRDPGLGGLVLAIALALVIYGPTLEGGILNYDDSWLVRDNWIVQDASWASLHTIFFDLDSPRRFVLAPEYLPVRDLSVMLDFAIWGDWFPGHHLTNVLLYLGAIAAWFGALIGFGLDRKLAGIAVLLWALHPAHAESVAWLAERKGLLAMLFTGLAVLAFSRFRSGRSASWILLATVLAVAGVWSKAHAAFALAALAALEFALPALRVSWRRSLLGLGTIGAFGLAAFAPVLLLATASSVVGAGMTAPADRLEMILGVHGFYLRLGAMTIPNSVSYPISIAGPRGFELVVGAVGLVVVLAIAVLPRVGSWTPPRELRVAAALWLFGWFPVSHVALPLQMVLVADRYLLLPTLGLALAASVALLRVQRARLRNALIATLMLAATLRSLDARSTWREPATLWARAVETNPRDGSAWGMYAQAFEDAGRPDLAEEIVARGLTFGRHPRLLVRDGMLRLARGDQSGVDRLREAAEAGDPRAMSNLALLLLEEQPDDALAWARRAAALLPDQEHVQRSLGKIALATRHLEEARAAFSRAFELAPRSCTNGYNLGVTLMELARLDDAQSHLEGCVHDPVVGSRARAALIELARRRSR